MDDIITAIQNKEIENFTNDLNSQNENLKFKAKIEENKHIPFLDLLLSHTDDGSMNFKVYRSMHVRMTKDVDTGHPYMLRIRNH